MVLNRASELFECDFEKLKDRRRLYGKDKDIRDLLVCFFWEGGAYTNEEIGNVFGITYTAVSHIVNQVKRKLALNGEFEKKYKLIKSQNKM